MADDPTPIEYLADPLSDITRKERRALVAASAVGVLVAWAGIVPSEIAALGIKFDAPAQNAFLYLLIGTIAYFAVAFVLYGLSDFLIWRKKYHDYRERSALAAESWTQEDQEAYDMMASVVPSIAWLYRWSTPAAVARLAFEYLVPLAFAVVGVALLLLKILEAAR